MLSIFFKVQTILYFHFLFSAVGYILVGLQQTLGQGRIQGRAIGAIAPLKPQKVTLFTMILHNSENNIRVVRPFFRPLFCHSSFVK